MAWTKLRAPISLPVSTPPLLAYSAKATLRAAGGNPSPNASKKVARANSIGLCVSPIEMKATISANNKARARFKSNKGEWISLLIVLRPIIVDELEDDESRSGVVSTGVTGNSRMSGFGFKILIAAKRKGRRKWAFKRKITSSNLYLARWALEKWRKPRSRYWTSMQAVE